MSFPDEQESFSFSYDPLNEPINILVQLAKDGEIDPWDIDIVSVTDKFLARLDKSDLRTSARALLYASVLLRIKSDIIFPPELPPEEDHLENEIDSISNEDPLFIFEKELDRRLTRKRVRGSPRTLEELVRELRDAELNSNWKLSRQYDTSDSPRGFWRGVQRLDYHDGDQFRLENEPTEKDVIGTAHVEPIEESISQLSLLLQSLYEDGKSEVSFEELIRSDRSRVSLFLALLFMAQRGNVYLEQEELFGDLRVKNLLL
ncbi:MAG: segregation/condensation protein A [Halobacteriales archaeon]|tara:strand:+ start:91 stop:870 length:780 start_codon:yes stop_codon:yes gene_type:complete